MGHIESRGSPLADTAGVCGTGTGTGRGRGCEAAPGCIRVGLTGLLVHLVCINIFSCLARASLPSSSSVWGLRTDSGKCLRGPGRLGWGG